MGPVQTSPVPTKQTETERAVGEHTQVFPRAAWRQSADSLLWGSAGHTTADLKRD